MRKWFPALLGAMLLGPPASLAAEPGVHLMFKPLRIIRIGELVQIDMDIEVTGTGSAPTDSEITFIGSDGLEARFATRFGLASVEPGRSIHLRRLVTVPAAEMMRWERDQILPRFRIAAAGGRRITVVTAVPAGPPEPLDERR